MRKLTRTELKNIKGGALVLGGGCKDACTTGMTCALANGTTGSCSGTENCNGTDGNVYIIKYCK